MNGAEGPVARRAFLVGAVALLGGTAAACASGKVRPASATAPAPGAGPTDTDWTRLPAGPIPALDPQGRAYLQTRIPASVAPASIGGPRGAGLRADLPDGRSASYVVQDLRRPVAEIGAVFAFGPGNELGSLCLARFDRWNSYGSRGDVRSTCHLGVTPTRWIYGVFRSPTLEVVRSQEFAAPIAQDGTAHSMRVFVRGTTATVVEPDGTAVVIDDPRVAAGPSETFACWEFFKLGPGAGDVTFLRTWAR